ncbi:MAG: hypothetical protein V4568_11760 [Pseudomonadota bacterium]
MSSENEFSSQPTEQYTEKKTKRLPYSKPTVQLINLSEETEGKTYASYIEAGSYNAPS